ncbi:MAG: hypothetical protein IPL49_16840 [Saprospirales bacterium]|nr:hypothetical protein [Saprospirales bacterium]MBK8492501.1 hypothetical protein [Saprospirales bacterium]
MKKIILAAMAAFMLLSFTPVQVKAATGPAAVSVTATKAVESAEADVLLARLDEIKTMDKSALTSAERKELRKETRAINSELKQIGGGVYVSVGAALLIILLLIILL